MNQKKGLARLVAAACNSYQGCKAAWKHEEAFRQEVILLVLLSPLALWLGEGFAEKAILLCSVVIVVIVELLNSAVEALTDRVSMDYHKLSGRAKDMGSAAVLLSIIQLVAVWGIKIWALWGGL